MYKVVIVGKPNVGKSTLFNTLIGQRKAIVEKTSGVTRDIIEGYVEIENNKGILLVDTGGINWGGKEFFSKEIIELVEKTLESASLILFVVSVKEGLSSEDLMIADFLRKKNKKTILVINKVESKQDYEKALEFYNLGLKEIVFISAKNQKNISELKEIIKNYAKNYLEEIPRFDTIKIAIIGRPNVGKSTLINKLLGYKRMIVSEIPGTTRDCVDVVLTLPDNKTYILIDTPGIRRRSKIEKRVEKFSVDKALETIKKVDIVILMITAEEGITNQDQRLLRQIQKAHKACLLLVNKWDIFERKKFAGEIMLEKIKHGIRFISWIPILTISAKTGKGINQIFPLLEDIYHQYTARFSTSLVNKILEKIKESYSFNIKGKKIKFYYATQVEIKPPTFVVFTNIPSRDIPQHIQKFINNNFHKHLNFDKVPIKVVFKMKN